jgi:hypothetical protein
LYNRYILILKAPHQDSAISEREAEEPPLHAEKLRAPSLGDSGLPNYTPHSREELAPESLPDFATMTVTYGKNILI